MHQIEGLYIAHTENKGRAVYTAFDIPENSIVEISHIISIPSEDLKLVHQTVLHDYYFIWDMEKSIGAIALGFGSLYNHSDTPNLEFENDFNNQSINFRSNRLIKAGEELLIDYQVGSKKKKNLWFDPKD